MSENESTIGKIKCIECRKYFALKDNMLNTKWPVAWYIGGGISGVIGFTIGHTIVNFFYEEGFDRSFFLENSKVAFAVLFGMGGGYIAERVFGFARLKCPHCNTAFNRQELFLTAAGQGDAEAQYRLGRCYLAGEDVIKDESEAIKWFRQAAEQGHEEARDALRQIEDTTKASET